MTKRIFILLIFTYLSLPITAQEQVYEFRTYELEVFKPAKVLHDYFEKALIPALNRQGIDNIGAFEESSDNLPKKIYLLIAYENILAFKESKEKLDRDKVYLQHADSYFQATDEVIPFEEYTSNLILSTSGFPELVKPAGEASLFELRIYESKNEDALRRKVKMFNDSEFEIFEEVELPIVFFGSNIAGTQMPCLTYLLAFKNMDSNKAAWEKFGPHPEWQRIIKLEEYADAMNDITRLFLKPLPYSQL